MKRIYCLIGIVICVLLIGLLFPILWGKQDIKKETEQIEGDKKENIQKKQVEKIEKIKLEEYEGSKLLGKHLLELVEKNNLDLITDKTKVDLYPSTVDFSTKFYVKIKKQEEVKIKRKKTYILHCLYEINSFKEPIGFFAEEE